MQLLHTGIYLIDLLVVWDNSTYRSSVHSYVDYKVEFPYVALYVDKMDRVVRHTKELCLMRCAKHFGLQIMHVIPSIAFISKSNTS